MLHQESLLPTFSTSVLILIDGLLDHMIRHCIECGIKGLAMKGDRAEVNCSSVIVSHRLQYDGSNMYIPIEMNEAGKD